MPKILVTGGCGYIGSHTIIDLIEHGFDIVSIDSNVNSDPKTLNSVEKITGKHIRNYPIDICKEKDLQKVFEEHTDILGIIHFAAFKSVPESVEKPLKYYQNNITGLLNILACIRQYDIAHLIFSSSCSVYGNTTELPVKESTPIGKIESPYAQTKLMSEKIIQDFSIANPTVNSVLLRYFNPAGFHPSGRIGQVPAEGTYSVVPILVESLMGVREEFVVTGINHNTRDGSCIRDYIHVMDIANAHTKALDYLIENKNEKNCEVFNIGIGEGISVLELIEASEFTIGQKLSYRIGEARVGDISAIYADYTKAKKILGWSPRYNVNDILSTTWKWYQRECK